MKTQLALLCTITSVAIALCGCGKTESPASNAPGNESAPTPGPTAESTQTPTATPTQAASVENATHETKDLISELTSKARSASDTQLTPIADEIASKVKSLETETASNETVRNHVTDTLKSLVGGQDSSALASVFDLAKNDALTPEQIGVAKEVGNVVSAYVVQKNFASLEGSQSDVATIVNSPRKGQPTAAVPALKNVAQNASLTPKQKELVSSLADQYAPGLKKAAAAASEGLDSLKKLPGLGK